MAASFPAECRHVLETLGEVYNNDALAREQGMSSAERLSFHKAQSGPIMDGFQKWLTQQLMDRLVEPNSGLGRAMTYFLRHWDALTLFQEGHPAQEERFILQDPKRRLGRRCLHEPVIHTSELSGVNPFDYLAELQRHAAEIAANPPEWMPWNYRATLERGSPSGAAPRLIRWPPPPFTSGTSVQCAGSQPPEPRLGSKYVNRCGPGLRIGCSARLARYACLPKGHSKFDL